jgi:hypothetical protein
MNLYLLLAIALGAIAGTAEVPAVRRPFAAVVAKSVLRAERQTARCAAVSSRAFKARNAAFVSRRTLPPVAVPLTGATTPRAPTA